MLEEAGDQELAPTLPLGAPWEMLWLLLFGRFVPFLRFLPLQCIVHGSVVLHQSLLFVDPSPNEAGA